jgi:integrase
MQKPFKNDTATGPENASRATDEQRTFVRVAECLWRNTNSGRYYAFVKRNGKQFHHSLKTADRQLAEKRLTRFREKVENLKTNPETGKMTFKELADRWYASATGGMKESSALRRKISINALLPFFKGKSIRSVTRADCDRWVIERGNKISASSFNNEHDTLVLIFQLAVRDGLILDNPATHIPRRKLEKAHIVIPTKEQFRVLVAGIRGNGPLAQDGADLVELLAYSGLRLREATSLTWAEIDWERGTLTVTGGEQGTKNLEVRTVPLFKGLRELLERLEKQNKPRPTDRIISIESAKRTLESVCKGKSLPKFHHHSLRHFFVSNAIEAGVDFKVIAGWVGHKDGGVLVAKTYGHLRDTHSFEMAKKMTFSALPEEGAKTTESVAA